MEERQRQKNIAVLEWFDALIFALALVLTILVFVFRTVNVEGSSMMPTLADGDQLIARSLLYTPQRGDIVVVDGYTNFGSPLVKRVIALGGDEVDIDFEAGIVYVNSEALEEEYTADLTTRAYDIEFPLTVPQGTVFLLGDNRMYSKDSRHSDIGFIDERDILGKVIFRLLPFQKLGVVE